MSLSTHKKDAGINPADEFVDPIGRPRRITDNGVPLRELIGA